MHGFSLPLAPANSELLKHQCIKYLEGKILTKAEEQKLKEKNNNLDYGIKCYFRN